MIGATSTALSASLAQLPGYLVTVPQAENSVIYMADGSVLATEYEENRTLVNLDQIAPIMQQAQVAIEDHGFYEHGALDLKGLIQAVLTNLPGNAEGRGGSTLTQQYVKQARIEAAQTITDPDARKEAIDEATANSLDRKIVEMRYAIGLEKQLSKDKILENYLNIAYYGDGAYGVQSAAWHYFGVSAANLTLSQAAMLAGIVQTPSRNPVNNLQGSLARRTVVLGQMVKYGYITQAQADAADQEVFDPNGVQTIRNGCVGTRYPFICMYAEDAIKQMKAFGDTSADRLSAFRRGGYSVYLSIDPAKQDAVQAAVSGMIAATDPVIAVSTAVQPGTGLILAMAQNRYDMGDDQNVGQTWYNNAVQTGFQAGSTFKAFTVAAALTAGISPNKTYDAASPMSFGGKTFQFCDGPERIGPWRPSNDSGNAGVINMYTAAMNSVNTYFVQLEQTVGICAVGTMAAHLGVQMQDVDAAGNPVIKSVDPTSPLVDLPSLTLGTVDVTPLSMAAAYATFAARGVHCDPIIITQITDRQGASVDPPGAHCTQAIDAGVADGVNRVLSNVWRGTGAGLGLPGGRPAAGKSGTTENSKSVWFMGYTPDVVTQAMIAVDPNPNWADFWNDHRSSLAGVRLPSGRRLVGFGASDAGAIWRPAMIDLLQDVPPTPFTAPPSSVLNGKAQAAPKTDGMTPDKATQVLQNAGFTVIDNKMIYSDDPVGTYLGASCDGRYAGTCFLQYSQGPRPPQ